MWGWSLIKVILEIKLGLCCVFLCNKLKWLVNCRMDILNIVLNVEEEIIGFFVFVDLLICKDVVSIISLWVVVVIIRIKLFI